MRRIEVKQHVLEQLVAMFLLLRRLRVVFTGECYCHFVTR